MFFARYDSGDLEAWSVNRKRASHVGSLTAILIVSLLISTFVFPDQLPVSGAKGTAAARLSLSPPLTLRWRYASSSTLNLTPASDHKRIYLPLAGGTIVSLRAND